MQTKKLLTKNGKLEKMLDCNYSAICTNRLNLDTTYKAVVGVKDLMGLCTYVNICEYSYQFKQPLPIRPNHIHYPLFIRVLKVGNTSSEIYFHPEMVLHAPISRSKGACFIGGRVKKVVFDGGLN